MILLFPNLDTLRLALSSSIVPAEVTLAPAAVTFDDQGKIYLESDASLTRTATKNLDRIGVKGSKRHAGDSPEKLSCWPQALPVVREAETPSISSQAPVLFELSDADDLPTLATEMLRLGNDRQGFRWFSTLGDAESHRVLLRVIGPPYYTLLRALDKSAAGTKGTVRAYVERAPRVWVELGYAHPLAQQIRVAEGQFLLIRAPREWIHLDESPFQDIYEIIQFALPARPVEWMEAPAPQKIAVPLKLTAGNAADVPELWVLRDRAVEQLDALVRDSDDRLTQRLMFAVARDPKGTPTVVLRTRPSKLAPPHLALENVQAYKPFWKLTNLFVPVGKRLHLTLRRDAVRKLLAGDPDQVVWLHQESSNGFTPESVPDGAFRPLEDWVDYVIEAEQKPLAAWIEATRFDFDHFICKETGGPKTKPDKGQKEASERDDAEERGSPAGIPQPRGTGKGKTAAKPGASAEFLAPPEEVKKPSEWKIRRAELEKRFHEIEGGLDAPERQALWPQLAVASAGVPEEAEAAISWLNAMWNVDPIPAAWLEKWVRGELAQVGTTIRAEEFDRMLGSVSVGQKEARTLVAAFLWLAAQKPVPSWLNARLPAVQTYVEKNEGALPVRAAWLAGHRLAQLSGSDVLGLARVRDRTLNRLLTEGLSPEKDLPSFLRYAGHKDSERMRIVREKALDLHSAVRNWSRDIPQNLPYMDLYFAFALAKLQEPSASTRLIEIARKELAVAVPSSWKEYKDFDRYIRSISGNWLLRAFEFRINQVHQGKPTEGPLSAELTAELEDIRVKARSLDTNNPYGRAEYLINRMRYGSRILEPQGTIHPYSAQTRHVFPLQEELSRLHEMSDINGIVSKIRSLLTREARGESNQAVKFRVLAEALLFGPRAGEDVTLEWIEQVPAVIASCDAKSVTWFIKPSELLIRAIVPAGHFGRRDLVRSLVTQFSRLVHTQNNEDRLELVSAVGTNSLRVMKKLGMRDEIDTLYSLLHREVLRGTTIDELRRSYRSNDIAWSRALRAALTITGGWLSLGLPERAEETLLEVRRILLSERAHQLDVTNFTLLARGYVSALGHAQSEVAITRIVELFAKMKKGQITNTTTAGQGYSPLHLQLVEDVIRSIVSDDFALGPGGRKWLDDDEYLVRRRIHADMKRERDRSGI